MPILVPWRSGSVPAIVIGALQNKAGVVPELMVMTSGVGGGGQISQRAIARKLMNSEKEA